jgi:hypothetical protein
MANPFKTPPKPTPFESYNNMVVWGHNICVFAQVQITHRWSSPHSIPHSSKINSITASIRTWLESTSETHSKSTPPISDHHPPTCYPLAPPLP